MSVLILGLLIFLGVHSIRIFADDWRTARIAQMGEKGWKGAYSVASIIGLALVIWGYGMARHAPVVLWLPPAWAPHLAGLLTLVAFILFPAAYVPGTHFKAWLKHPQALRQPGQQVPLNAAPAEVVQQLVDRDLIATGRTPEFFHIGQVEIAHAVVADLACALQGLQAL